MTKTETSLDRYSLNAGDDDEYPGNGHGYAVAVVRYHKSGKRIFSAERQLSALILPDTF